MHMLTLSNKPLQSAITSHYQLHNHYPEYHHSIASKLNRRSIIEAFCNLYISVMSNK